MAMFLRQNENRSPLQEKLAEELREKAKLQAGSSGPLDQTRGSNYLKDTEVAEGGRRLWLVVAVVILAGFIILAVNL